MNKRHDGRDIGEIAQEAYRQAAIKTGYFDERLPSTRLWAELCPEERALWTAVEEAVGQDTVKMMGDVLDAFGVQMPPAMRLMLRIFAPK